MSTEKLDDIKFIRIHENVYISEASVSEVIFADEEQRQATNVSGGGIESKPTGRKNLTATIHTVSGEKRFTRDKFAEELRRFLQAHCNAS
jgi:hypothetical protein